MKYEFDAVILKQPDLDSGYIEFPYDAEKEFGNKGQVKVRVLFDGYEYRGSLVRMGHTCHWIGVNKEVRKAIHKNPGDPVHVIIEKDEKERTVGIPEDFSELLMQDRRLFDLFGKLSYTNKKEYIQWIESAKKPETRNLRMEKVLKVLREK